MPSVAVAATVTPAVETLIVPVPRTSAVVEVWSEFASALGVSASEIDGILRKGLDNFLLASASVVLLNDEDEVVIDVELTMDWKKHQMVLELEPNIELCPQRPFTEQLHTNFQRLLVYLRQAKGEQKTERVELQVRYRDEIYAKPDLLAKARAFLGLEPAPPRKYANGVRQPEMTFRFAPVPETTFVVREIWPPK